MWKYGTTRHTGQNRAREAEDRQYSGLGERHDTVNLRDILVSYSTLIECKSGRMVCLQLY